MTTARRILILASCELVALGAGPALAHNDTLPDTVKFHAQLQQERQSSAANAPLERPCILNLHLRLAETNQPVPGLVRITPLEGKSVPVFLEELCERPAGWFSMPADAAVKLPRGRFRIEAVHGIETAVAMTDLVVDEETTRAELTLALQRIYDPAARDLRGGNTHLHLLVNAPAKMGVLLRDRVEADRYLQYVGASDGLDLLYVSYLTAPAANLEPGWNYISNEYTDADFARFSHGFTLYRKGVEHRHSGAVRPDPGTTLNYGHVMFLDFAHGSIPASIGPGLSDDADATDGVPLRAGIIEARNQDAAVIWCHGTSGLEDIPNWVAGLLHAQNIYDGGNHGNFEEVFYPYLNAGFKVAFSTGTDWGVWDFSRVYVTLKDRVVSQDFLKELKAGRSYITNEPFLEFSVSDAVSGDTITLAKPGQLRVHGRAVGRSDFLRLQLVQNGKIVKETATRAVEGHYESTIDVTVTADQSGWIALRVPTDKNYHLRANYIGPGTNLLGKPIFAHTSPVYLSVADQPTFDAESINDLLLQVRLARKTINEHGKFRDAAESEGILAVYRDAEDSLVNLLETNGRR